MMDGMDALLSVSLEGPKEWTAVFPSSKTCYVGAHVQRERMSRGRASLRTLGGQSNNEQNDKLIAALEKELETNGPQIADLMGQS